MNRGDVLASIAHGIAETGSATRKTVDVPPYVGFIDVECDVPWMSLAMPVEPVAERGTRQAHEALKFLSECFAKHSREIRFELFDRHFPEHASVIETAGFVFDRSDPLLAISRGNAAVSASRTLIDGASIEFLPAEIGTCCEYVVAARRAFGGGLADVSIENEAAALRRDLERGRVRCATLRDRGEVVSTAMMVGVGDSAELAGVGTIPGARGKGYASEISKALIQSHFERGNLVWLSAGSPSAEGIYRRLGFERIGSNQLNYHA